MYVCFCFFLFFVCFFFLLEIEFFNDILLCLTISAELMKLKFVRRLSSVCVAIISRPTGRNSFKFGFLVAFGHSPGGLLNFEGNPFPDFLIRFCSFFVNLGPYGSKNLKRLLPLQITVKRFQTSHEFSSHWSSQNCFCHF